MYVKLWMNCVLRIITQDIGHKLGRRITPWNNEGHDKDQVQNPVHYACPPPPPHPQLCCLIFFILKAGLFMRIVESYCPEMYYVPNAPFGLVCPPSRRGMEWLVLNVYDSLRPFTAASFPHSPPSGLSPDHRFHLPAKMEVAALTTYSGYPRAQCALSLILSPWWLHQGEESLALGFRFIEGSYQFLRQHIEMEKWGMTRSQGTYYWLCH